MKMNLDTDMQWAFWDGVHGYYNSNKIVTGRLGNPEGEDKPNKKFYDPRAWLRSGEQAFVSRLKTSLMTTVAETLDNRLMSESGTTQSQPKGSPSVLDQLKYTQWLRILVIFTRSNLWT